MTPTDVLIMPKNRKDCNCCAPSETRIVAGKPSLIGGGGAEERRGDDKLNKTVNKS